MDPSPGLRPDHARAGPALARGAFALEPATRRLLLARALRSVGQGVLVVDLALYLHALGWNAVEIGGVLSGAGFFGALLSLAVGISSDRLRRKPFLLAYEALVLVASVAALLSTRALVLVPAIVAAGFGRGAGGAAGPFSPAEQAWLAEEVAPTRRGRVYSMNSAFGFFGMGGGAVLAALPEVLHAGGGGSPGIVPAAAYRPSFALVAAMSVVTFWLLYGTRERYRGSAAADRRPLSDGDVRRRENSILARLVALNAFNGMAIGLTGPLMSYWFARRFHVGPQAIGPVMALAFVLTGVAALLTGKASERVGLVQPVIRSRSVGLALLVLLPLMPLYELAALMYVLRSVFNRGTVGARQALTIGLVRDQRRGLATSLNAVSMQLPQSVGPSVAGLFLHAGRFALPFYVAALLQGAYLVAYARVFRGYASPDGPTGAT